MPAPVFDTLSDEVKGLLPIIVTESTGNVLGVIGQGGSADRRTTEAAKAAIIICHEYAPLAPLELLQEASVRLAGWLIGAKANAASSKTTSPSGTAIEIDYLNGQSHANGFRVSGASALLTRYRIRRAAIIG